MEKKILDLVKKEVDWLDSSTLTINEVGDGNVNYIYRVSDGKKSVIVKFADSFIRDSTTRKLSTKRNEIEYEILNKQSELTNHAVPTIYHYSSEMNCIIMEDMKDYYVLREGLQKREHYPHFAQHISVFLYNTLIKSTDLIMNTEEKKVLASKLVNIDMCEISERLVFTEPYFNNQGLNSYNEGNKDFVQNHLYNNEPLKLEVAKLKYKFMNYSQSMLHGDLHGGSIFINEKDIKVFDPEFSFYGPAGYDIGNVIASFVLSFVPEYYKLGKTLDVYTQWLEETIYDVVDLFKLTAQERLINDVTMQSFINKDYLDFYIDSVLSDSAGYAGTEIIRRTVGVAKVWDLNNIQDKEYAKDLEQNLLTIGEKLIMNRNSILDGKAYKNIIREVIQ